MPQLPMKERKMIVRSVELGLFLYVYNPAVIISKIRVHQLIAFSYFVVAQRKARSGRTVSCKLCPGERSSRRTLINASMMMRGMTDLTCMPMIHVPVWSKYATRL